MRAQLNNIPFGMINKFYGKRIGKSIGKIIDYVVDKDGVGWDAFLRLKIWVDITKPLVRGCLIQNQDKPLWISFKYKRLPNFYFNCDLIKHSESRCPKGTPTTKIHEIDQSQYGTWLRAIVSRMNRKRSTFSSNKKVSRDPTHMKTHKEMTQK